MLAQPHKRKEKHSLVFQSRVPRASMFHSESHTPTHMLQLLLAHVGLRLQLLRQRPHLGLQGSHVHWLLLRGCRRRGVGE